MCGRKVYLPLHGSPLSRATTTRGSCWLRRAGRCSQGDQTMIYPLLEEGLSLDKEVGDKEGMAVASLLLGWVALKQGDVATARSRMEESLVLYQEMEHREGMAEALSLIGKTEATLG